MLFSVIIPTFNRREFLEVALESVWAQTMNDYEVVVVDDGSTDETAEFLAAISSRVTAVRQENRGPGAARNLAVRHARGEYLAFLDSDDVWFPWTLETYAGAIGQGSRPAFISGIGCREPTSLPSNGDTLELAFHHCMLDACKGVLPPLGGTPSVVLKREVFNQSGGFIEQNVNAEDIDLWFRLGLESGFVRILSPPTFRQGYVAVSAHNDLDREFAGILLVLEREATGEYPGRMQYRMRRRCVLAAMARSVSLSLLNNGRHRDGWSLYLKSFWMQMRFGRLRYICGFPARFLRGSLLARLSHHRRRHRAAESEKVVL